MSEDLSGPDAPQVSIPDIRDYERINAELVDHLNAGHTRVRLVGAEGQRFLAAGLSGPWKGVVDVEGRAGPELAAGLNAPGLTVVCHGFAADGAGRGLRQGRLVLLDNAGDGLAYAQEGGWILAVRNVGHRAGLNQRGGVLIVLGGLGRLAGERQSGGKFFTFRDRLGLHAGLGHRAGQLLDLAGNGSHLEQADRDLLAQIAQDAAPWIGDAKSLLPAKQ